MNTASENAHQALMLAGSYRSCDDGGFKVYGFNTDSLQTTHLYDVPVANASYMAVSRNGVVYAVTESDTENSLITALRTGADGYELINSVKVGANSPCHIAVTPDGRFVVTANYGDGTIAVFAIADDTGALGQCGMRIAFKGHGPFPRRQAGSRIHCIRFTPDNRFMLVCDLGNDSIYGFRLLPDAPVPIDRIPDFTVKLQAGSGPRHIVFNSSGDIAYLINEISDTVTVLRYNGNTLEPVQYISANTEDAHGAGDICLSQDGNYVFASLRLKNDGIATFRVNSDNGTLQYLGHTPSGIHPRNIFRHGKTLLVACKDTGAIEMYREDNGTLTAVHSIACPMAVFSTIIR